MMWNELIPVKDKQGNDTGVDILLLDCEGLNQPNGSFDMDVKLFCLTILLASTLVYNQIGHISDQALETLSVIQMLTSQLKYKQ